MVEVAAKKIGDGAQPDMRMRPDIDALSGEQFRWPGLIEKDERPDHLPLGRGQGTPDLEPAQIAGPGDDERLDSVDADLIGAAGVECGVPTHALHPLVCSWPASRLPMQRPDPDAS